jgi:4,4'-diaponeurosporenoate glycosyltransferase
MAWQSVGCWNGAKEAKGELLLFLAADTVLERNGIHRLMAEYYERRKTILSVHPHHKMIKPYEYMSSFFHMMVFGSLGAFHFLQDYKKPAGAFGQCMLCKKKDYFKFGGHAAKRGEILENMAFGQYVLQAGGSIACVSGKGAVFMRMYPDSFASFIEGWSKNFAKGTSNTNRWMLLCIALWMNGIVTSCVHLLQPSVTALVFYLLFVVQIYWVLQRIGDFGLGSALLYPLHVLVFLGVFVLSFVKAFLRRNILWKGRIIEMKKE